MKPQLGGAGLGHITFDDQNVDTSGVIDIRPGAPITDEAMAARYKVLERARRLPKGTRLGFTSTTQKEGSKVPKRKQRGNGGGKQQDQQAAGGQQVDGIDPKDLAAQYGWALSVLKSDPELYRVFRDAVAHTYSPDRFIAEVRSTGWFQHHSDATRNYIILKQTDPRTFENRLNQARSSVRDAAVQMGAQLGPKALDRIADNFLRFGWNDAQLRDTLAGAVKEGALGTFGGDAAKNVTHLRAVARANGVQIADKTLSGWAVRLAAGESMDGFDEYIRGMAKSAFPGLEKQLDAGMNVADVAEPYRQQMAQRLELNPEEIDLFDPTLRSALQAQNKDGQIGLMPLWQFDQQVMNDKRYDRTQQANNKAASFVAALEQKMGNL